MYPPTIAAETPDAAAYVMAESGSQLTFAELDAWSNALAHLLRRSGVVAGDSLVIFAPNDLAWPVAVAAGMRTGLQVTPVNWHVGATELRPMLHEAAPAAIVTTTGLASVVLDALAGSAGRRPLVLTVDGEAHGTSELWSSLDALPTTPIDCELLGARVLFSGGTTGTPKAFRQPLLGVHPLEAPARHPGLAHALGIERGIRFLSPAPSYHAAPFTFQLITMAVGGTVVCMEAFDAIAALTAIDRHGVTHSQWVPTMLSRLLQVPDRQDLPLSPSHRVAITSGAPCPVDLKAEINDWWGDILHEYYGASEGYGHTYISPSEARERPGSVGRPLGAARVRIVDESGVEMPPGNVGRVCFETTTAEGEVRLKGMGDVGRLDEDGYLYLTGRQTFMIISGGVNIYPEEIEGTLSSHRDVADVAVFGAPHPDLGEQVVAVVELRPGTWTPEIAKELTDFCRDRLARFKAPRRIEFVERLPRLPTGKLNKKALQTRYARPTSDVG